MFNEFRNPQKAKILLEAIHKITRHSWHIMEICGGQTHALAKYKIEELLPDKIRMIHGPGCPVCVTPVGIIDMALHAPDMANMPAPVTVGALYSAISRVEHQAGLL